MGYLSLYDFLEQLLMNRTIDSQLIYLVEHVYRAKISYLINWYIERGILEKVDNKIRLIDAVEFLVYLPLHGIVPDRLSMYIKWYEFEEFITKLFVEFGWDVYLNYRHNKVERFQIDVIAVSSSLNLSLFIECKHWKRASRIYASLENVVEDHIKRVEKYLRNCEWVCSRLNELRYIRDILPVVVTLCELPVKVFRGVPVVSIHKLYDFIVNIDRYIDSLKLKVYTNKCYGNK